VATFAVRIPLSYLFSRTHGVLMAGDVLNRKLYTLGFAAPIASLLSIAVLIVYIYRQQRAWRKLDGADISVNKNA
jgi:uncharacterized membrane protein